jgi:hypothetical protein
LIVFAEAILFLPFAVVAMRPRWDRRARLEDLARASVPARLRPSAG